MRKNTQDTILEIGFERCTIEQFQASKGDGGNHA